MAITISFSRYVLLKCIVMCLGSVDCVGILKLRNADVEARIGVAGSKKKSTRARLAFRVNIPRPDGSVLSLQALSSPILCSKCKGYKGIDLILIKGYYFPHL